MVRSQDNWSVIDHSLAMDNAEPEENPGEQFDEVIANPIVRIQNALVDLQAFHLQTTDDFAHHAFDRQVRAVDDVRILSNDERRGPAR